MYYVPITRSQLRPDKKMAALYFSADIYCIDLLPFVRPGNETLDYSGVGFYEREKKSKVRKSQFFHGGKMKAKLF